MYAAGYSIRPLQSSHHAPLRHIGRWSVVILAVACVSVVLSKVAFGDSPTVIAKVVVSKVAFGDSPTVIAKVVVQPGDTLWGIAATRYPADDVRLRVDEIERLNGLHNPKIEVGETLRLPA